VIKLKSAKGTCSLSPKKLTMGTYHLVATYGGSVNLSWPTWAPRAPSLRAGSLGGCG
jgi:hypothetical protein